MSKVSCWKSEGIESKVSIQNNKVRWIRFGMEAKVSSLMNLKSSSIYQNIKLHHIPSSNTNYFLYSAPSMFHVHVPTRRYHPHRVTNIINSVAAACCYYRRHLVSVIVMIVERVVVAPKILALAQPLLPSIVVWPRRGFPRNMVTIISSINNK